MEESFLRAMIFSGGAFEQDTTLIEWHAHLKDGTEFKYDPEKAMITWVKGEKSAKVNKAKKTINKSRSK